MTDQEPDEVDVFDKHGIFVFSMQKSEGNVWKIRLRSGGLVIAHKDYIEEIAKGYGGVTTFSKIII